MDISMENFRAKERSENFAKLEVDRLQTLIEKYKNVIMCKKTDATSARQKESVWMTIFTEFNAVGSTPRTLKQLKNKFENMKKTVKKNASIERQEMRRTGGGPLPPPPPPGPEDNADWLRSVMSSSIDGNEAIYDDDVIMTPKIKFPPKFDPNVKIELKPNMKKVIVLSGRKPCQNDSIIEADVSSQIKMTSSTSQGLLLARKPWQNDSIIEADVSSEIKQTSSTSQGVLPARKTPNVMEATPGTSFDTSTPYTSLKRPISSPLKRQKNKFQKYEQFVQTRQTLRERKIDVLDKIRDLEVEKLENAIRHEKELHDQQMIKQKLEIKKLELEIALIKEKFNKE